MIGPGRRSADRARARAARPRRPSPTIPLRVVYEDDDLLIVDKPAGPRRPPVAGPRGGTLVNALLGRRAAADYGGIAGVQRPGIVHRLDRDTSGLLMVARTDAAQHSLMAQLKARRIKKTYLALVLGEVVGGRSGRIEAPIGRDPKHRTRMAVVAGRPAVDDRLPRPRAVRAAGRCSSSTSSPAGPTRSGSISRRSATRSPATRSTAPGRREPRARTGSSGCSSTPGGSSSPRRATAT